MKRTTGRRDFLRTAAVGAAGAALSGGFKPLRGAFAQAGPKVTMGYLPVNVDLPTFKEVVELWKAEGLNIELYRAQGGPAILQALASGDVPTGDVGMAPAVVAATRGLPFYYLTLSSVSTPKFPLDRIMVLPDSPIRKFEDLKGKTLAINQIGTMPDASLSAANKMFGISKADIKLVPIPYPNMPQVLEQKQVDAIFPFPPADTVAEVRYNARTVIDATALIPYLGYTTIAVRRDFADANPDVVKRIVRGTIKGQRWIADNIDKARESTSEFLQIPADIRSKVRMAYFTRNGLSVLANAWHVYFVMLAGNIIKPVDDAEKMMNDYFVEPTKKFVLPALAEIGMQKDPVIKDMLTAAYPLLPKPAEAYHTEWDKELLKL
jgi:ABC-type nitrate/sulfonate/bicarbonate transport system substrate-binding protein